MQPADTIRLGPPLPAAKSSHVPQAVPGAQDIIEFNLEDLQGARHQIQIHPPREEGHRLL